MLGSVAMGGGARKMGRSQIRKDLGFFPRGKGRLLRGFRQQSNILRSALWKDHFGFRKGLDLDKSGNRQMS